MNTRTEKEWQGKHNTTNAMKKFMPKFNWYESSGGWGGVNLLSPLTSFEVALDRGLGRTGG